MRQLRQTNKSILFATINSNKHSLSQLVNDEEGLNLGEEVLEKIDKTLLVSSFDEFLEKFEPTIYSTFIGNSVKYSLKKDQEHFWFQHAINMDNDFMRMIVRTIDGKDGLKNIEFNYEECLSLLGVDEQAKKIDQVRNELKLLLEEYERAEEGSSLQYKIRKKSEKKLNTIVRNYINPMSILPDRMEKVKRCIEQKVESTDFIDGLSGKSKQIEAIPCFENGRFEIKEKIIENNSEEIQNNELCIMNDQLSVDLETIYNGYLSKYNMQGIKGMQEMLVETFFPQVLSNGTVSFGENRTVNDLCEEYNEIAQLMEEQLTGFSTVAKQLIETVVGVKLFFDQSKIKKNGMKPQLIVSNCDIDAFNDGKLELYLEAMNDTTSTYDEAIWYAIIPNVEMSEEDDDEGYISLDLEEENKDRSIFDTKRENIKKSAVKELIKKLAQFDIQTFISFEHKKENSFSYIRQYGIEEFMNTTKGFEMKKGLGEGVSFSNYVIPCLPNFTIIPEEKAELKTVIYQEAEAVNDQYGQTKWGKIINIGGFYIGAAFVAAGIVCACQSPDFLSEHKLKVDPEHKMPGVRFDIEKYSKKITTTIGTEISGYGNKVRQKINEKQYGFLFGSEGNSKVSVFKARTLMMNDNNEYDPIFKQATATYIKRLYEINGRPRPDDFFGNTNKAVFWEKYRSEGYVNALLQEKDELIPETVNNRCNVELKLQNVCCEMSLTIDNK